ncbi:hypothetical protein LPUS_02197 [Lasallia pustulata]|uniref:Uncharacterized protein n=1 Tax=Lasallia pustulata TaxID=136370 RepID=A0A1W5CS62_9LECA|nr:hypothetical protein LPUS_02197 [Lasallia pustulata]
MAAADIVTAVPIPGLHRPFIQDDMKVSPSHYNGLNAHPHSDMHVEIDHVRKVVEIIARHASLENSAST